MSILNELKCRKVNFEKDIDFAYNAPFTSK